MVYRYLILSSMINFLIADIVQFGGELYMDGQNARNLGMGGYSASFSSGANPAQLMHIQESSLHFSHKDKFSGLTSVNTFSYMYPKLIHGIHYPIFISLVNRSVNDIPDTRSAMNLDGSIDYSKIEDITQNEVGLAVASVGPVSIKPSASSISPTAESHKSIFPKVAIKLSSASCPLIQSPSKVPSQFCPVIALTVSSLIVEIGAE